LTKLGPPQRLRAAHPSFAEVVSMPNRSLPLLLAAVLAACAGNAPIVQVKDAHITLAGSAPATLDQVRAAIVRGSARKGWRVVAEEGQSMALRVDVGGHWAVVLVDYTPATYSITHSDSSPGLRYDGHSVHPRYNRWVVNLQVAIDAALAEAPGAAAAPAPAPAAATPAQGAMAPIEPVPLPPTAPAPAPAPAGDDELPPAPPPPPPK
jgi:hypothetical protein